MAHKLREAMAAEQSKVTFSGSASEIDGAYFGGTIRQRNVAAERVDRRSPENQPGTKRVVVVIRERKGRTLPFVFKKESEAIPTIRALVPFGATIHADETSQWDSLHAHYDMKRINHSEAFSRDGACTNQAESFFSRLRRSELGIHHRVSGKYLGSYATEMAWCEDRRRIANGAQFQSIAGSAINHPMSRNWRRYWQRSAA